MRYARTLLLQAALLAFLTACGARAVRPSSAPEPPPVHCEQGPTPDLEPWPDNWLVDGPPWAIGVLGLLTEERQLRADEHRCLADLRKRGIIK